MSCDHLPAPRHSSHKGIDAVLNYSTSVTAPVGLHSFTPRVKQIWLNNDKTDAANFGGSGTAAQTRADLIIVGLSGSVVAEGAERNKSQTPNSY